MAKKKKAKTTPQKRQSSTEHDTRFELRISTQLLNKAQVAATKYAKGNLSAFIRDCIENYHPKFLKNAQKTRKPRLNARTKT